MSATNVYTPRRDRLRCDLPQCQTCTPPGAAAGSSTHEMPLVAVPGGAPELSAATTHEPGPSVELVSVEENIARGLQPYQLEMLARMADGPMVLITPRRRR